MSELSTRRALSDIVAEYEQKKAGIAEVFKAFNEAGALLVACCSVAGEFAGMTLDSGRVSVRDMEKHLLKSAWRHAHKGLQIERIATAADKRRIAAMLENPPEFTIDALREQFGDYLLKPRFHILRGLAEAFSDLDQAYKSHERIKIGVKGLPKRVILNNVEGYGSWGKDRLENIINALAAIQGLPMVTWAELRLMFKDGEALREGGLCEDPNSSRYCEQKHIEVVGRDIWLKKYANGNGHLYFGERALYDINKGLAEFFGEVLADCPEERPKKATGTAVSKDLQYYPTPVEVVQRVLGEVDLRGGKKVLEPSCGCGRFMDIIREQGGDVFGIEYDAGRVVECRSKGHSVLQANFLETVPVAEYDLVVMNPPFAGRHYMKHLKHAMKYLKEGGALYSVLPASAWYDHGEVQGLGRCTWRDLPVASFSESGTNIPTGFVRIWK